MKEEITMKKLCAILLILVLTLTLSAYADDYNYTISYTIDGAIEGTSNSYLIEFPADINFSDSFQFTLVENHSGANPIVKIHGSQYGDSGWYMQGSSAFETLNFTISDGTSLITNNYTWTLMEANPTVSLNLTITDNTSFATIGTYTCPVTFNVTLGS